MDRVVGWVIQHRAVIGVALFALGLGVSVWLGFAASAKTPINGAQLPCW